MALDATPGSPSANSYCTVSQATVYLSECLHVEPWYQVLPVTEGYASLAHQREASLIWATRLLDEQCLWYGTPATMTQALAWPQSAQVDARGRPVPSTVIPDAVQRATAFYALALVREQQAATTTVDSGSIKSRKVGDLQITYHDPRQAVTTPTRPAAQGMPADVRALLTPYAQISGAMTVRLLRT